MANSVTMTEIWRGGFLECIHQGDAVICDVSGNIVQAWGNPDKVFLPRSSCKMVQALPLIETGAADAFGLRQDQLALSCASHQAAAIHTDRVQAWLTDLGLGDDDLRCGPQEPNDREARDGLIQGGKQPCRYHNNCSGKHSGFLTVTKHLGAGPDYVDPEHPLQQAVKEAFEDVTGLDSPGHGIDGCSAPNFATSLHGLARAMAFFASAQSGGNVRHQAASRLVQAMLAFPELVAGEDRACTDLMRAMGGKVALKGGAEGAYVAILPEQGLGVALKINDGASRGSECAIAALMVHLGVLDPSHPAAKRWMNVTQRNFAGLETGVLQPANGFPV